VAGETRVLSGERALEGGPVCGPAVRCQYDVDGELEQRAQVFYDLLARDALG
jgi:hypothetical protein